MRCWQAALAAVVLSLLTQAALAAPTVATAATASAAALRTPGGQLAISLQLEGDNQASTLQLERRDVWRAGAQVVVHTPAGQVRQAPPATRFFTGRLAGVPGSDVVLAVDPTTGRMTGKASRGNAHWSLAAAAAGPTAAAAGVSSGLAARKIPAATGPTAAAAVARPRIRGCGNRARRRPAGWNSTSPVAAAAVSAGATAKPASTGPLQATITIDTDAEFFGLRKFGGVTKNGLDYIGLMTAYLDAVYSREVGVGIKLGQVEVRNNSAAADYPKDYRRIRTVENGLAAVEAWWNSNRQHVPRAATLYLSGQTYNEWVAMAGDEVLCDWYRAKAENKPSSNKAYGFVSWLEGDFDWSGIGNPTAITSDIFNFAHELGHIFGSPHTHEYCDILDNPKTVDDCAESEEGYPYQGGFKRACRQDAVGVLPTCTSAVTAVGGGPGTLMSYCDMVGQYSIGHVSMTFGLNHPCGNEPSRVPRTMKQHVEARNTLYPQCLQTAPTPKPSPPPPPPPAPTASGNWTHPIVVPAKLPYTSPSVTGWTRSGQLPMFCNDSASPMDASGKRLAATRGVKVYRWKSSATAKGTLTVHSCGLTKAGSPGVSVRATPNSANPLAGPWTCMGAATSGCGSKVLGFRLTVTLRPSTVYDIIVVGIGTAPALTFSASVKDGTLLPWPAPAGSWRNPHTISKLPFNSTQFNVFHADTAPAQCTDQILRKKDAVTLYTRPARVFRMWTGAAGKVIISSCAHTRALDNPNVSVRSTANKLAPLDGPWQCVSHNDNGCGTGNRGFSLSITVAKDRWYYILVSHTNTAAPPLLKLSVTRG